MGLLICAACSSGSAVTQTNSGGAGTPDAAQVGLDKGAPAPDFSAQLLNGSIVSLKALHGKVVLLNFWATWCGPCRVEMPIFQRLADSQNANDFVVLAVNYQESADKILPFTQQYKLKFDVALDISGKINQRYTVQRYPTTYVIGRDGLILVRQFGPFEIGVLENALKEWVKS